MLGPGAARPTKRPIDPQPVPPGQQSAQRDARPSSSAGELLTYLQDNGIEPRVKAQPPSAPGGVFTKDRFVVDLGAGTVACPAGNAAPMSFGQSGAGTAHFRDACADCPLREACTTSKAGRTIGISAYEELVRAQRERCTDPELAADYRGARPKVERNQLGLGKIKTRHH